MAQSKGNSGKMFLNGKEIGTVGEWSLEIDDPEPVKTFEFAVEFEKFQASLKEYTFPFTFVPTSEFMGWIVGMQLEYGLRELHRNLGRYCSWPYTN